MTVRCRIKFDAQLWSAVDRLCLDAGKTIDEIAEEAFRDLLKKRLRPIGLRKALRESARMQPTNSNGRRKASVHHLRRNG